MGIKFHRLNRSWNAEPNAPNEKIYIDQSSLFLEFNVNPWEYSGFAENERVTLKFISCSNYRLGPTNDEGWYLGQCRYGKAAPKWGEFYQICGAALDVANSNGWIKINYARMKRHYLFYLKDNTFECYADSYEFLRSANS